MTTVIFPGTFDPVTMGHLSLISKASKLFGTVIVAVAKDTTKKTWFTYEERLNLLQEAVKNYPNVKAMGFEGLLVSFMKEQSASAIIRGVRDDNDFAYELQLAGMNRLLDPLAETVLLMPDEPYRFVSSSFVRQAVQLGGDITRYVSPAVYQAMRQKLNPV